MALMITTPHAYTRSRIGLALAVLGLLVGCHTPRQAIGASPQSVRASETKGLFRDVAVTAGLNFRWGHPDWTHLNILDTIGHGCAFLDYDGDGRLDVLL